MGRRIATCFLIIKNGLLRGNRNNPLSFCREKSGVFNRRAAGWFSLLAAHLWRLLGEIALLCLAFEDIVRRIARQWLNTHQFPAIFPQRIHISPSEGASALIIPA